MTRSGGGEDGDRIFRSTRVVTPHGVRAAAVHLRGGRIERVSSPADVPAGAPVHDAGDGVVMPGVVDTHVHVNEPGRTEWEGFETATRAAAAGGVTTLLDMPLNSIPATTTVAALEAKRRAAAGRCHVNVGFIGGVVPGNAGELAALSRAGVRAFKCFMVHSGVPEFACVGEADLREALPVLASLRLPLMVHAELAEYLLAPAAGDGRSYRRYMETRPARAELEAVALAVRLAGEVGARVHIVHLSSAASLPPVRAAREGGQHVTVETCPHYLTFAAGEIPDGATELKCAPPIREASERDALLDAVARGEIDMVVTDHSPCPPDLKRRDTGDFMAAWGGIASLQSGLPAVWTRLRDRPDGLTILAQRMCAAPAELAGLGDRKGRIAPGYDADLVIWDPEAAFVVQSSELQYRHKLTPYAGRALFGVIRETIVGGRTVYAQGTFSPAAGVLL